MPGQLHRQVTGKPVRALDQDDAHAVVRDAVKHRLEARPLADWVGTAHGSIVELVHDGVAGRPGERGDGGALALVAVLAGADAGRRACAQIGNGLDLFLTSYQLISLILTGYIKKNRQYSGAGGLSMQQKDRAGTHDQCRPSL